MELAIQLYGYLILTFLAIVTPIFGILLSTFREGLSKLSTQYENEIALTKENIKKQAEQIAKTEEANTAKVGELIKQLEKGRKSLEKKKKTAQVKLSYLNPRTQILLLFLLLSVSFVGVILAILCKDCTFYRGVSIVISLGCFGTVLVRLDKLLGIIIEVRQIIDGDRKERETDRGEREMRIIELLSALAKRELDYFVKDICIAVNGKDIKDDRVEIKVPNNVKSSIEIAVNNSGDMMAKNIEIALIFDPSFVIEKKTYYSIYTEKTHQIVRYTLNLIQAKTYMIFEPLIVTPMKEGEFEIRTAIRGENIRPTFRNFELKVRKVTLQDILLGNLKKRRTG